LLQEWKKPTCPKAPLDLCRTRMSPGMGCALSVRSGFGSSVPGHVVHAFTERACFSASAFAANLTAPNMLLIR
jgi:hypothetical protein